MILQRIWFHAPSAQPDPLYTPGPDDLRVSSDIWTKDNCKLSLLKSDIIYSVDNIILYGIKEGPGGVLPRD